MVVLIAVGCASSGRGLFGTTRLGSIDTAAEGGQIGEPSTYDTTSSNSSSSSTSSSVSIYAGSAVLAGSGPLARIALAPECGDRVVGPGDVDGDGLPDVGVSCGGSAQRLELYSVASLAPIGTVTFSAYDGVVTALGDLDGDGLGDLGFDPGPPYDSSRTNAWGIALPGAAIRGTVDADELGWALIGDEGYAAERPPYPAGDVDGDGVPDLAVVARQESFPTNGYVDGARVRLVAGSALGAPGSDVVDALADLPNPVDYGLADQALGAGDVDGDGKDDVLVGPSPWALSGNTARAAVYLVSGGAPGGSLADAVRIDGPAESLGDGRIALARVGDLDGDGRAEVVAELGVYDPHASSYRLAVVPGSAIPASGAVSTDDRVLSDAEIREVVACDLDGDGLPELVTDAGVWAGTDLLTPGAAPIAQPPAGFDWACLGDVDGDGAEDLAVGWIRGSSSGT